MHRPEILNYPTARLRNPVLSHPPVSPPHSPARPPPASKQPKCPDEQYISTVFHTSVERLVAIHAPPGVSNSPHFCEKSGTHEGGVPRHHLGKAHVGLRIPVYQYGRYVNFFTSAWSGRYSNYAVTQMDF